MNTLVLQPAYPMNASVQPYGPTLAHKAGAFMILIAASAAFVVMCLWPLVARFA